MQSSTKYTVKYQDNTLVNNLSFDESYSLFKQAFGTSNTCSPKAMAYADSR